MRNLVLVLLGLLLAPVAFAQNAPFAPFSQKEFTDVPTNHTHYEAIESLRERNILRGYPEGDFRPSNRINRAEFVFLITNPILMDTLQLNECLTDPDVRNSATIFYPDVHRDAWYAAAICHATKKGLIDGYPNGKFMPGEYINFAEAAKIISSAMTLHTDEEPGERWFDPYTNAIGKENAIPVSIRRFDQMVTRGEMAEMLYRLLDDITDREHRSPSSISF